jgi:hypothetical protein
MGGCLKAECTNTRRSPLSGIDPSMALVFGSGQNF